MTIMYPIPYPQDSNDPPIQTNAKIVPRRTRLTNYNNFHPQHRAMYSLFYNSEKNIDNINETRKQQDSKLKEKEN